MEHRFTAGLAPAVLGLFLFTTPIWARTWHVAADGSGDAPTIQAGVDSAAVGDTVLVGPGHYSRTSQGATATALVTLHSGVVLRGAASTAATVLDGELNGTVIQAIGTQDVRIENLTITRGRAMFGGGIDCEHATIADCDIVDNRAVSGPTAGGGGIECTASRVLRCRIRGNVADSQGASGGGAYMVDSTMRDCWLEANSAAGTISTVGGGVTASGDSIVGCTFVGNGAGSGAGASVFRAVVMDCVFSGNYAGNGFEVGGALEAIQSQVVRCTLVGNLAQGSLVAWVGGLVIRDAGSVESTLIVGNEGAACYARASDPPMWSCCDVFGNGDDTLCGTDAGGNFSLDPQFCAVDAVASRVFGLQSDSPCAPGNHPAGAACGLIGAAPVNCGPVAVQRRTWTDAKRVFR